ncbi:MAG TPA: hypothetical protein VI933_03440 [archaeon]|nr:hypothetical protein [archaeon]
MATAQGAKIMDDTRRNNLLSGAVAVDGVTGSAGRVYGDAAGSAGRMSPNGSECRYSFGGDSDTTFAGVSHRLEAIGTIRAGASNRSAFLKVEEGVTGRYEVASSEHDTIYADLGTIRAEEGASNSLPDEIGIGIVYACEECGCGLGPDDPEPDPVDK